MKKIVLSIALFLITCIVVSAQTKYSTNNYRGNWVDGASWSRVGNFENNVAPRTNDLSGYSIGIHGYITRYGDLDLGNDGNKSSRTFTIYDTLVITGNLQLDNEAMDIVVPEKGLLIVFGNFNATNKITVLNGGTVIVKGTMSFNNSGHDDYTNTLTGNLYTGFEPTGNSAAAAANMPLSALPSALYNFIMQDPTDGDMFQLPVELLYIRASAALKGIQVEWAAAREWNFSHYTLERSENGKDFVPIYTRYASSNHQGSVNRTVSAMVLFFDGFFL